MFTLLSQHFFPTKKKKRRVGITYRQHVSLIILMKIFHARSSMSGTKIRGKKIAGIIFAVFTLVQPRIFVPIKTITSEPVTDIQ